MNTRLRGILFFFCHGTMTFGRKSEMLASFTSGQQLSSNSAWKLPTVVVLVPVCVCHLDAAFTRPGLRESRACRPPPLLHLFVSRSFCPLCETLELYRAEAGRTDPESFYCPALCILQWHTSVSIPHTQPAPIFSALTLKSLFSFFFLRRDLRVSPSARSALCIIYKAAPGL